MLAHADRVALIEASDLALDALRVDLLDVDGSKLDEIGDQVSALEVKYIRNGPVQRSIVMTTTAELVWGRHRVAPYATISGGGLVDVDVPLGVYQTTYAPLQRGMQPREFVCNGFDLLYLAEWPLIAAFTALAGTIPVVDYAEQLLSSRGLHQIRLDKTRTDVLTEPRSWTITEGKTTLDVINALLAMVGYEAVSMTVDGVAVSGPIVTAVQRPTAWVYDSESPTSSIVVDAGQLEEDPTKVPNVWTFYIDEVDRTTPIKEGDGMYTVHNASDGPASIAARGNTFPAEPIRVDAVTQADLEAQGDKIAAEQMRGQGKLHLETDANPYHQHRDVVYVNDPDTGIAERFMCDEWNMTVTEQNGPGMTMDHTLIRVTAL
jgi:hypothetical protein